MEKGKIMGQDMTVPCGDGYINIRVGAIIMRNGRVLMAKDDRVDYYYSVGGRVQFGETAEQAIVREMEEETGVKLEIDRLGFVHQNYFIADAPPKTGKTIYELSMFYYMKVPEDFSPDISKKVQHEFIEWVPIDTEKTIYPEFFKTELLKEHSGVKFISTDER